MFQINSGDMEIVFIATLMETAIVVVLLAILFVAGQLLRKKARLGKLARNKTQFLGEEARAVVLSVEQTGLFLDRNPQVILQVQVMPDKGRNFVVEIKEIFSLADLQLIRPGCTVRVKYKPGSNQDIILVRAA